MKVLAVSGSLRRISKNATIVRAALSLAPPGVEMSLFEGLGLLPLFNPDLDDLDRGEAPRPVLDFRQRLRAVDGVFICSPEYAHGVAGAMKNALDWLVGSGEFEGKPTLLFNVSPASTHGHIALAETLRTMGASLLEGALPRAPGGKVLEVAEVLARPEIAEPLRAAVERLVRAAEVRSTDDAQDASA